ncbi:MAG: tetraacyldisaccharide 4'-kinase [Ignavibacteriales bacterium]|nr:tetraacyldisaccharide 4'-kinase [Ignavibacteriales bacterium]
MLALPLAPLYWAAMAVRNALFNLGAFKSRRVGAAVVSVGNLTTGGSGKTPLTIYVLDLLRRNGYRAGALSRGYGRSTRGYRLVSDGEKTFGDVTHSGDEMWQIASETGAPSAVCEDRVVGAERLIEETGVEALVLDDAFQHRWIARDVNLLVIERRLLRPEVRMRRLPFPTGDMREPFSSAKRADAIVVNHKFAERDRLTDEWRRRFEPTPIFYARYEAIGFVDVKTNTFYDKSEFYEERGLIVGGLAYPRSFVRALSTMRVETGNRLFFRDHKDYDAGDVEEIRKTFYATNAHSVLTTQKDAVKLARFSEALDDVPIFYLKIATTFEEPDEFERFMTRNIEPNESRRARDTH